MKLGMIGLGKIGNAIAQRVVQGGHEVIGFDINKEAFKAAQDIGVQTVADVSQVAEETRIIWLSLPAGKIVDDIIKTLVPHLKGDDIIIDGGNSKFTDSINRANMLSAYDIFFLDCGTSGGLQGRGNGFCLMFGGDKTAYTKVHPILVTIAAPDGVAHVGPSGAGHYVKMVHNGVEYALLQAYAEGFQLIRQGSFKRETLDLEEISRVWNHGSIIRSWILELIHGIFEKNQKLANYSGKIEETGMGKWAVEDAKEHDIPLRTIDEALKIREWSRESSGNYATTLVALLRHAFGGHPIKKIKGNNNEPY